jgi:hypothetical protein
VFVRWPAGALVAALVLTAACSDAPGKPAVLPTASSTSSSTSTSTPIARDPRAEVEAFVRAYYAEVNRALVSGRTENLARYSTSDCSCRRLIAYIDSKFAGGKTLRNARFELSGFEVIDVTSQRADVGFVISAPAYEVLDGAGRVVERIDSNSAEEVMTLLKRDQSWVVVTIGGRVRG